MQTSFTPAASTLFLQLDDKTDGWYYISTGKGAKNFFDRAGKALLLIPLNLLEGTVGALAGFVYDLTLSVIWGLGTLFTRGKNQKCASSFYAHLNSLGRAGSHAFNHIAAAILFPLSPLANLWQPFYAVKQENEACPEFFEDACNEYEEEEEIQQLQNRNNTLQDESSSQSSNEKAADAFSNISLLALKCKEKRKLIKLCEIYFGILKKETDQEFSTSPPDESNNDTIDINENNSESSNENAIDQEFSTIPPDESNNDTIDINDEKSSQKQQ